jgi:tRNA-modifying protein YgfZ
MMADLVRNYGDPAAEYAAARDDAGVIDRADRAMVRVYGRDPVRMIQGLVTNDVAGTPADRATYAALLTPKGKMVADLRIIRHGDELLLECDAAALAGVLEHLRRFVPPLFARFEDATQQWSVLGVYGPRSEDVVRTALGDDAVPPAALEDSLVDASAAAGARAAAGANASADARADADGSASADADASSEAPADADANATADASADARAGDSGGVGDREAGVVYAVRTRYAGDHGIDIVVRRDLLDDLRARVEAAGARRIGHATLDVLRIEAGRPRWGYELTEDTIPLEADLLDRAISTTKGCYTGQEVIVRILHRGHVNWHLRGVLFGNSPTPPAGAGIVHPDTGKRVARVTSVCASPAHDQTIGLCYARRELEPPVEARLGDVHGAVVTIVPLPFPVSDVGGPPDIGTAG